MQWATYIGAIFSMHMDNAACMAKFVMAWVVNIAGALISSGLGTRLSD